MGPGWSKHRRKKHEALQELIISGKVYRNVGYWRRTDFAARPECLPTAQGALTYCEPEIVWVLGDDAYLEAFPYDCREALGDR